MDERAWGLALLGADLRIYGPLRVSLDGGYGHTWSRDASGIAEARLSFGVGPTVAVPLVPGLELHARLEGELQQLRADVVQPSTGREDASGRTLGGFAAEADLQVSLGAGLELFAGDRLDFWGSRTTVRVANAPVETLGGWLDVAVAGLNVRLP
jgi:outer membrane protein TolC